MINKKYILDKSKQPIDINNYEHPTGTLAMNFLNPVRE